MQHRISMCFYTIKIHPKRHPELALMADKLPNKQSLINLFEKYVKTLPKYDAVSPKVVKIEDPEKYLGKEIQFAANSLDKSQNNYISAVLHGGHGGFASDIVDRETGNAFKRTIKHVELIPFYICLDVLLGTNVSILGLQRFGVYGISSEVTTSFEQYLKKEFPEHTVKICPIFIEELFVGKYLKDGHIRNIELTKYMKVGDRGSKNAIKLEQSIYIAPTMRGGFMPPAIKNIITRKSNDGSKAQEVLNFYSLDIAASDFESIIVEVDLGGTKRKIDIQGNSAMATYYDVTQDVATNKKTGHPIIKSLQEYVIDLVKNDIRRIVK